MSSIKGIVYLLLVSLLLVAAAAAQNSQTPQDESPGIEQDDGEKLVPPEDGDGTDEEDETITEPEPVTDNGEAAEADPDSQATMERFRPTEKISEDNSVAFPNDI
jgi:hypothetical protein